MATQQQSQPRPRIPLAASISNRDELPTVDARLINGYLEKGEDKALYTYRRPGTAPFSALPAGPGRGIYNWLGDVYAIVGTQFYKNTTAIGTVSDDGTIYTFSPGLGGTPKLFFHNTLNGYNYDGVDGLVGVVPGTAIVATGDIATGTDTVMNLVVPAGPALVAGMTVSGVGIPDATTILSVDSTTQITLSASATNTAVQEDLSFLTSGTTAYPPVTVPGCAYLDATTYVMDSKAHIYASDINDATSWDPESYLTAQVEPDMGVALWKQLVYIIAFKEWSTEFFYDGGNATGSPLTPVQGNKINQGCRNAGTVAEVEGALVWVSTTRQGNVGVWIVDSARGSAVGTPPVERLLQNADYTHCTAYSLHISGHKFYVLNVPAANLTLCLDLTSNEWYRWTDTNGNYLPFVSSTFGANKQVLVQHATNGMIYRMASTLSTDSGAIIPWDLYTPNYDAGQRITKECRRMDFIGDQTPGTIIQVSYSEDDYQTWSSPRWVDMGQKRPTLRDCGSFRRRAWHLSNRTPTFLRIQMIELDLAPGTS